MRYGGVLCSCCSLNGIALGILDTAINLVASSVSFEKRVGKKGGEVCSKLVVFISIVVVVRPGRESPKDRQVQDRRYSEQVELLQIHLPEFYGVLSFPTPYFEKVQCMMGSGQDLCPSQSRTDSVYW